MPGFAPLTTPVPLTVATVVALLDQVPPVLTSVRLTVAPAHTGALPEITDGSVLTVTTVVAEQPVPSA